MTTNRIFNFSAGPAVLPPEVLEQARENLLSMPGVGMSILEISHRSKPFDEIIEGAEADLRALAGIPDGYKILFLSCTVLGSMLHLGSVLDFSDLMILGMAFPNVLGLFLLHGKVRAELKDYWARLKRGELKTQAEYLADSNRAA